jgi:putative ABC transport system ATP-binding protein
MIKIKHLEFDYATNGFHLHIGNMTIERGSATAIIGPSGTGKTTLLNLIAGVSVPLTGQILIGQTDMTHLNESARREFRITNIGMVFQEFELLGYLRVIDNILLPYRIHPALRLDSAVRARAVSLARQAGIADKLSRFATKLSQGEKQRVAVCRSLLVKPSVILADEPTGNLDPANKERILDILLGYVAETGCTLLTVTHDHSLLNRFSWVIDMQEFQPVACQSRRNSAGGVAS